MSESKIVLFRDASIRSHWDAEQEEWFFSVVDVVAALTDSANPTDYLKKLRKRDEQLGEYVGTNCPQVAMPSASGKSRKTLAATTQQLFRIIQSIPSKKAEPFKLWLAEVGSQRLDQLQDPELSTKEISEVLNPQSLPEHEDVAKRGGGVAKEARLKLEAETGKPVVTSKNAKQLQLANKAQKKN